MHQNVKYTGFLIGAGLILSLPLIFYGFPFHIPDVQHAIWYSHFSSQLWSGELYPRWLMGMNGGLGAPTFFYYAPVPYYLTSLLKPFFAQDTQGWHQLGISASIALTASGVCAYLWLIKIASQKAAFVAALIYMVMPYHLATNVYDRGAFAEIWTFVWMPLILLFTEAISRGLKSEEGGNNCRGVPPWAPHWHRGLGATCWGAHGGTPLQLLPPVIGLVASYALLIMTQLPTTLMFSLVPIVYACYQADRKRRIRTAAIMLGAMSLSVGLSAIYLLPALLMQKYVFMEELTAGFYYYGNWFLPLKPPSIRASTSAVQQTVPQVAILGSFAYLLARKADDAARKRAAFWIVVLLLSVFMMVRLSSFIWQLIPPLQMIQFPFRFSSVLCVATAALLALGMSSMKGASLSAGLLNFLALLMIVGWLGYAVLWARISYGTGNFSPATVHRPARRQELLSVDVNEFRPRWVVSIQEPVLESLLMRIGESADGLAKVKMVEGTGTVEVKSWKPREIVLQVDTTTGALLDVSQFYFSGWSADTADQQCNVTVQPSKPGGLVRLTVPTGNHRVLLRLNQTLPEYAGKLISGGSAILLVLLVSLSIYGKIRPRRFLSTGILMSCLPI